MPEDAVVYMDNHATTRVDPLVVEAMLPYLTTEYGNAGSLGHAFGRTARNAVDNARNSIASLLHVDPAEIVFTSGATESNNLAIRGIAEHRRRRGNHFVTVRTEHIAVLDPLARLERHGLRTTLLDVEPHGSPRAGWLDPQRVADAITNETVLVSVMLANNEIGVIQPLEAIAAICRQRGVPLHCDATQAVGRIPVDVPQLGVDLMSFTAHKIYGPKGVGALYVRRVRPALRLEPQITGGGQEQGRRSGTLNVAGIVGLARALELCCDQIDCENPRLTRLRNRLWSELNARLAKIELTGPALDATDDEGRPLRLPGNLNLTLGDVEGEAVLLNAPEVAISAGATCSSNDPHPSHVLLALDLGADRARSSLRFGLGRFNSPEDVDRVVAAVGQAVHKLRETHGGAAC